MRIAVTGAINSAAARAKMVIWPISLPSAISKLFNVEGIQSCSFYDDYSHSGGVTRTEIIARHRSPKPRVSFQSRPMADEYRLHEGFKAKKTAFLRARYNDIMKKRRIKADAQPFAAPWVPTSGAGEPKGRPEDRKSTRLNSSHRT